MKVVKNKYIPFKGYKYINLFGIIFTRQEMPLSWWEENHEMIHTLQQRELLFIGFYIIYLLEYIIKLTFYKFNFSKTYDNISFEREAYDWQYFSDYLDRRKHYSWIKYIFKKTNK